MQTKHCRDIASKAKSIKEKCRDLIEQLDDNCIQQIEDTLLKRTSCGWMWMKALHFFYSYFVSKLLPEVYLSIVKKLKEMECDRLALLHATQIFSSNFNLTYDDVCDVANPIEKIVILRSLLHCEELQSTETFSMIDSIEKQSRVHFLYER